MKRLLSVFVLVLLVATTLAVAAPAHAQTAPSVKLVSNYILNRYGFATLNLTATAKNTGTEALQWPGQGGLGIGIGDLASNVVSANVTSGYQWTNSSTGGFEVTGGGSVPAGGSTSFSLVVLLNGVTTQSTNGSLLVKMLTAPSVSVGLSTLISRVSMPSSTLFVSKPTGFSPTTSGTNTTYVKAQTNVSAFAPATTLDYAIQTSSGQDFHPLDVYSANRVISVGPAGSPLVQDTIFFKNEGGTPLQLLYISPLTASSGRVTIEAASEPPLLNPVTIALQPGLGIDLTNSRVGYPVQSGANYTIVYQYSLAKKYYSVSGGSVTLNLPLAPPIAAFVGSYSIQLSLPAGVKLAQQGSSGTTLRNVSPMKTGTLNTGYTLSVGWALESGVPIASVVFVVLLLGLFVSETTSTEEEETEEETATDRASAMIQAFEDKTSLINQVLSEIPNRNPNERDKEYFDGLRSRLDTYRSRALQRLNEVKQKSTTQRFFDLLNQLHSTEREVDRAAKDTLNLYEQFYTNRMRKEVFDKLLPSYRKRLEKALDQLSEELHVAQREAKLL